MAKSNRGLTVQTTIELLKDIKSNSRKDCKDSVDRAIYLVSVLDRNFEQVEHERDALRDNIEGLKNHAESLKGIIKELNEEIGRLKGEADG